MSIGLKNLWNQRRTCLNLCEDEQMKIGQNFLTDVEDVKIEGILISQPAKEQLTDFKKIQS